MTELPTFLPQLPSCSPTTVTLRSRPVQVLLPHLPKAPKHYAVHTPDGQCLHSDASYRFPRSSCRLNGGMNFHTIAYLHCVCKGTRRYFTSMTRSASPSELNRVIIVVVYGLTALVGIFRPLRQARHPLAVQPSSRTHSLTRRSGAKTKSIARLSRHNGTRSSRRSRHPARLIILLPSVMSPAPWGASIAQYMATVSCPFSLPSPSQSFSLKLPAHPGKTPSSRSLPIPKSNESIPQTVLSASRNSWSERPGG